MDTRQSFIKTGQRADLILFAMDNDSASLLQPLI
jgi:hypothetical protein